MSFAAMQEYLPYTLGFVPDNAIMLSWRVESFASLKIDSLFLNQEKLKAGGLAEDRQLSTTLPSSV